MMPVRICPAAVVLAGMSLRLLWAGVFGAIMILAGAPLLRANDSDETVQLPQFSVAEAQDQGYLASDSVTGSRLNTPRRDIPFTVDAFTQQFIEDIGATDLTDIVAYS